MKSWMLSIVGAVAFAASLTQAQIYKWKDDKGVPQYSSEPPDNKAYEMVPDNLSHGDGTYRPPAIHYSSSQTSQNGSAIHSPYPYREASWEACSKKKHQALDAEQLRQRRRAETINEWLWRNCREYSNELRSIEQQRM